MTSPATQPEPAAAAAPIPCVEPATGRPLGQAPITSPAAVRDAIALARAAQRGWAETSFATRRSVLRHVLEHLLAHADELCEIIVRDAGKTRENAMMGEIWPVAEKLRWTLAKGERHLRPERVSSGLFVHKKATIEYRPLGVVGVICPWNYPLQNILGPVIPALFAGNGCVVKVSEHVAWSAARFQRILDEAFEAHGLPSALVQLVHGYAETGAALVSGGVDLVVFTGSMANGKKVLAESAKTLTPCILELGGKDALVVCDDADLEQAAHSALNGAFIAAGQNCLAAERVLVMDGIYDAFVQRVEAIGRQLTQGPPLESRVDVGALVTPQQADIVEHLVKDALSKGARALVGGQRPARDGNYFEPTILVDVTSDMLIMHEETFGPVMVVGRVRDDADAIRTANDTQYGLSATVISKDARRAKRIADGIVAGSASINDFGFTYMAQDLPFGGTKGSGFGRLNGREGLRACTNVKAVLEDRFPIHMPSRLYPTEAGSYELVRGTLRTLYGRGLKGRAAGVRDLATTLSAKLRGKLA